MLGLGSLGQLVWPTDALDREGEGRSSGTGRSSGAVHLPQGGPRPPRGDPPLGRAPYRLFQLALSLAVAEKLRALGCTALSTTYCDPEYDALDVELIAALGGRVVGVQNSVAAAQQGETVAEASGHGGHMLLYMPCCPRQLYGEVIEAVRPAGALQRTAILGSSLQSLGVGFIPDSQGGEDPPGAFTLGSLPPGPLLRVGY